MSRYVSKYSTPCFGQKMPTQQAQKRRISLQDTVPPIAEGADKTALLNLGPVFLGRQHFFKI